MVSPGEAEGDSGDPQIRGITLVILLKGRVVVVILAEEEGCSGDPHGAGQLMWGSSWSRRGVVVGVWAPAPCYCW